MAAVVLAHLVISMLHGFAHTRAHVPLSLAADIFVFAVIVAGPLVGLALTWKSEQVGTWLIGLTMTGALIFGFVNHFVLSSPDHITHVDPEWRPLFTTTAALLLLTEAIGSGLAVQSLRVWRSR